MAPYRLPRAAERRPGDQVVETHGPGLGYMGGGFASSLRRRRQVAPPVTPFHASIVPPSASLGVNGTQTFTAVVTTIDGSTLPAPYAWFSSNRTVVKPADSLTPAQLVTGLVAGTAALIVLGFDQNGSALPGAPIAPTLPTGTAHYYDPINGNDSWDGLHPTFVSGTQGPKKTLPTGGITSGDTVFIKGGQTYFTGSNNPMVLLAGVNYGVYGGGACVIAGGTNVGASTWTLDSGSRYFCTAPSITNGTYDMIWESVSGTWRRGQRQTALASVTAAGDFFIDTGTSRLYYIARSGANPGTSPGSGNVVFSAGNSSGTNDRCHRVGGAGATAQGFTFRFGGADANTANSSATNGCTYFDCIFELASRNWYRLSAGSQTNFKWVRCTARNAGKDEAFDITSQAIDPTIPAPGGSWGPGVVTNLNYLGCLSDGAGCTTQFLYCDISRSESQGLHVQGTGSTMYVFGGRGHHCRADFIGTTSSGAATVQFMEGDNCCLSNEDRSWMHTFSPGNLLAWSYIHDIGAGSWGNGHQWDTGSHNSIAHHNFVTRCNLGGLTFIESDNTAFYQNTCVANGYGIANLGAPPSGTGARCDGVDVRNNILSGNTTADLECRYLLSSVHPIVVDYNLYGADGTFKFWIDPTHNGAGPPSGVYRSTAAAVHADGYESHGVFAAPTYDDSTWKTPASGGAQRNAGVAIAGYNDNYEGAAPDIGAWEYGQVATATVTVS